MRSRLIVSILVAFSLFAISPAMHAQNSAKTGPEAAAAIPDLTGNWAPHRPVPVTPETALCGIRTVCDELRGVTPPPMAQKLEEPEMQPWAEEKYRAVKKGSLEIPTSPVVRRKVQQTSCSITGELSSCVSSRTWCSCCSMKITWCAAFTWMGADIPTEI